MQNSPEEHDSEDCAKVYRSKTLDEMYQCTEVAILEDEVFAICTTLKALIFLEDHVCGNNENQRQYHAPYSEVHQPICSRIECLRLFPSPSLVNMGLRDIFQFKINLVLDLGEKHNDDK